MSLSAHLVGADVTELLPEFTLAQRWDLTVKELVGNVHIHSTLSEAQQGNVSWPGGKDDQLLDHSRSILTASARRAAQLRTSIVHARGILYRTESVGGAPQVG